MSLLIIKTILCVTVDVETKILPKYRVLLLELFCMLNILKITKINALKYTELNYNIHITFSFFLSFFL